MSFQNLRISRGYLDKGEVQKIIDRLGLTPDNSKMFARKVFKHLPPKYTDSIIVDHGDYFLEIPRDSIHEYPLPKYIKKYEDGMGSIIDEELVKYYERIFTR